ncbi:MAG TPA: hypothetical protein VL463_03120 [Kofleriaceae bacterium]|nr:hypothetical protein [Kofleriaceae bacterium]
MASPVSLAASPTGAWVARRTGAQLTLHAAARLGEALAIELATDDVDITFAGPPDQLVVVARAPGATQVLLYNPPDLEIAARAEIEGKAELAGVTGPRLALITGEHRTLVLVRCAPRALVVQPTESGPLVEAAIGLEDNKLLVVQPKKIEQWDAIARRAMLRLNLPLPPLPRLLGAAKGNFWSAVAGRESVYVYRASDGRAFEHRLEGAVIAAASSLASPYIAVATDAGLLNVHAFAHTTTSLGARTAAALAQAVVADEPILYGCDGADALWRLSLVEGASIERQQIATSSSTASSSGGRGLKLDLGQGSSGKPAVAKLVKPAKGGEGSRTWRESLVQWCEDAFAREKRSEMLVKPEPIDDPQIPFDAALSVMGDRISPTARRTLALLYGGWLRGTPAINISALAAVLGGGEDAWAEALGTGALGGQGWAVVEGGKLALAPVIARHLDGAPPRAVRLIGEPPAREAPHGVVITTLDERAIAERLGAIAVARVGASIVEAALEAKVNDAALVVAQPDEHAIAALVERGGDAIVIATEPRPGRLASFVSWPPPPPPPPAPAAG